MKKRLFTLFLCVCMLLGGVSCGTKIEIDEAAQIRNLQKLCKVWGFAKYTHQAFLTGQKDWDAELLKLIPVVQHANEDKVNDILYKWFTKLGDDGYDNPGSLYYRAQLKGAEDLLEQDMGDIWYSALTQIGKIPWISLVKASGGLNEAGYLSFVLGVNKSEMSNLQKLTKADFEWLDSLTPLEDFNTRPMAEMGWLTDTSYLGERFVSVLSRFNETALVNREKAPVSFDFFGNSVFTNEKTYSGMDYQDVGYRLLGLFRLWNAIEYYFPYRDIMDRDWNELLLEFIPKMLEGTDKSSYELTLAALSSHLHEAHVTYENIVYLLSKRFGSFSAAATLVPVDGQLVVNKVSSRHIGSCPLQPGDVILGLNGRNIKEVAADMLQYLPYPDDAKALDYLTRDHDVLRSHNETMEVDILRGGEKLSLTVTGYKENFFNLARFGVLNSYELLESNIGLINPSKLGLRQIHSIMRDFKDTDGLIIDLRQYPADDTVYPLAEYLVDKRQPFVIMSQPSPAVPGMFMDIFQGYSGGISGAYSPDTYFYKKPVVILMNIHTKSSSEFTVMSLRNGPNVTVMGSNSIGADGNVTSLPLPGGITMTYTGLGVYTPEGGQTQRIGLSPDIYVEPTIEGIKEGRDELMEAAVQFILDNK